MAATEIGMSHKFKPSSSIDPPIWTALKFSRPYGTELEMEVLKQPLNLNESGELPLIPLSTCRGQVLLGRYALPEEPKMAESVEALYDGVAESYHLMFENWSHSVASQAAIIRHRFISPLSLLQRASGKG
jgi:hypothetical protein